MIVVDTSVLVNLLRGMETDAARRLRQMELDEVPFFIPILCVQEVLQGARDEREWELLHDSLETQRLLVVEDPLAVHVEAARIFFDCRREGITVRNSVDCLIAAQVLARRGTLLHDDADFEHIKAVRPLSTLRG